MLLSDPGAPLPTPPPTSSSSSTTTTSIQCTYSLSPPSPLQVGSAGGTQSVTITTQAGCGWSAQSFDSWITMNPPFGGTGTTTITFNVSSATVGRTGRLLLAGHDYVVNQAAPLSDLIFVPSTMTCTEPRGRPGERIVRVEVFNRGPGPASASITRVVFSNLDPFGLPDPAFVVRVQTPEVAANRSSSHTLPVPSTCFFGDPPTQRCFMEARADYDAQVVESSEDNNRTGGECTRPAPPPPPIPITGIRRK
jgi:hypothetical protein